MIREPWTYDRHSHKVILNVGTDWISKKGRRSKGISTKLLNSPKAIILTIAVTVLLFLLLKEARFVLASSPQFMLQDIIIENTNLLTKDMVKDILKLDTTKGLFETSTRQIVKLLKKDPDVENVIVEKVLPGTLRINITDRAPYAKLKMADKYYFIDSKGTVLLRDRSGESVPVISGLPPLELAAGEKCNDKILEDILNLLHAGENIDWGKFIEVTAVDVHAEKSFSIRTRERILIKLKTDDLQERLDKLIIILSDAQNKGKYLKTVDLRFKDVYVE